MVKSIIIWLIVFVIVECICFFVYFQSTGFKVTKYEIGLKKTIDNDINIVMLSDLHDTDTGENNSKLLDAIDDINPDFVLIAGDMITSYKQPVYDSTCTMDFLERLSGKYKVYYSLGNHEDRYLQDMDKFPGKYEALSKFCKEHNIELLNNESKYLEEYNCRIYGLTIPIECYKRFVSPKLPEGYIDEVLGKASDDNINILLAHNPDKFDDYVKWNADIVCSGHVHGGIVSLPVLGGVISPQVKLFPKYDAGVFSENDTTMVLGRGLGWHTIPLRIFNKAELVHIVIKSAQ